MKEKLKAYLLKRVRNRGMWAALGAGALYVLQHSGAVPNAGDYQVYLDSFLGLLVTLGILSNSASGKWYEDEE